MRGEIDRAFRGLTLGSGERRVQLGPIGQPVAELTGDDGNDQIFGDQGADKVTGGAGGDYLGGGPGVDQLTGGAGDDIIDLIDSAGGDTASGGPHVNADTCRGCRRQHRRRLQSLARAAVSPASPLAGGRGDR